MRKKSDTTRIKKELQDFANDSEDMKNESVDAKWNMFQHRLTGIMDSCIPHKFTTSRHNLPWFNRSLRRQTRLKQRLYNRAKKSGRQSHWNKFKLVRKQLHKNLNRSRNDYLSDFLDDSIKQNPKGFWSHIKKLGKEDTDNQDLKVGNEVFTEPRAKAEVLNSQFSSVFNKKETENIPHLGENPIPIIATINITTSGVESNLAG